MAKRHLHDPKRMPGSSPEDPRGMAAYLVLLKEEDDDPEGALGRIGVYQAGLARNMAFQERLRKFLKHEDLADQVVIGAPTSFPLSALKATAEAARRIASLPEVQELVRDADGIEQLASDRRPG